MDPAVGFVLQLLALVASRSHNDDAGIGKFLDLPANRIVRVGIDSIAAEAKINYTNVMSGLVLQYPIKTVEQP